MRRRVITLVTGLLLMAAVAQAIGASQEELLAQGIVALHEKEPAQQTLGVSCLESVIQNAPTSPQAGTACYQLGCHFRVDREKSLAYFRQAYVIPSKDRVNAGISIAHTLVAMGRKLDAASAFEDVAVRCPAEVRYACYRAGMCYLGESRGKAEPAPLRDKAKRLFTKSAAAGNLEAKLQLLGMRWEDCDAADPDKADWGGLISDLRAYGQDAKAPAYARARAFLMIAEHGQIDGDTDQALRYTDEVLAPEFKGCRAEQAWAMYVRAMALGELGRWTEAFALYDDIHSKFKDSDNFGGNNVRAIALYCKAHALNQLGRNDEAEAVMAALRREYPNSEYALLGGAE